MTMIIETSKGAVSLSGATSITVKRNPLTYVPKLIGTVIAISGLVMLLTMLAGAIAERATTPWYGWLFIALLAIVILFGVIGGGVTMVEDSGKLASRLFRDPEDAYGNVAFLMVLAGIFPLIFFTIFLSRGQPDRMASDTLLSAFLCFALAGITYWSRNLAGKVDATIAYPTHQTTVRALFPYEADRLTAAFRERQPAA